MKQPISESPLTDRDLQFLQIGRGATIPGLQRAIDILQEQLDLMKTEMYSIQGVLVERTRAHSDGMIVTDDVVPVTRQLEAPKPKRGRPKKAAVVTVRKAAMKGYWASMTPEERSAEMKRRASVTAKKKNAKLHPRDEKHPDHAIWLGNLRKAVRKQWDGYSPAEKKRRSQKMVKARVAANKLKGPTVAMMLEKTA
jgi:hypothetical protein